MTDINLYLYAKDIVPWAKPVPSLTLSGLLDQRHTWQRQTWGRVLSGEAKDLAEALQKRFKTYWTISIEACLYLVEAGHFESGFLNPISIREIAFAFEAGAKSR